MTDSEGMADGIEFLLRVIFLIQSLDWLPVRLLPNQFLCGSVMLTSARLLNQKPTRFETFSSRRDEFSCNALPSPTRARLRMFAL